MRSEKSIQIASGHHIGVAITGELTNPVIMFINGSIFNYHQFDHVYLPKLRKYLGDDYCYIQYDYVGYAKSSDLEGEFDFVTIAEQHVEVMNELGIRKAHLFGLSKGSVIAQIVTMRYPERVISLAGYGNPNLANPQSNQMAKEDFGQRLNNVQSLSDIYDQNIGEDNFDLVYNTIYIPNIFDRSISELSILDKLQNWWIKKKLKPMIIGPKIEMMDKLFRYYKRDINEDENQRYIEGLKSIQHPTLFIHGTKDTTVPPSSSKLLAKWVPTARLELIDGYKHSQPTLLPWEGGKVMKMYAQFIEDVDEN